VPTVARLDAQARLGRMGRHWSVEEPTDHLHATVVEINGYDEDVVTDDLGVVRVRRHRSDG
jgi:hypothetical protein